MKPAPVPSEEPPVAGRASKTVVILNAEAGAPRPAGTTLERRIVSAFRSEGVDAEVRLAPGPRVADATRAAAASPGVGVVAAGGGDGTVSAAAGALAGGDTPLAVLPLGTLNHFALDLGVPMALDEAVAVAVRGTVRSVDLGSVNGHAFLNTSALGFYPFAVRRRPDWRRRPGKDLATFLAALRAFLAFPRMTLRLTIDGETLTRVTPSVLVGNNRYEMQPLAAPRRSALDEGRLSVYVAAGAGRKAAFLLLLHALLGTLDTARDLEAFTARSLRIEGRRAFGAALDGEIRRLESPLRYRILPGALRVIGPPLRS